jgi:hypothetical protein
MSRSSASCFGGILAAMAASEALAPRRQRRVARWPANLGIVVRDTLLLRAGFPVAAACCVSSW